MEGLTEKQRKFVEAYCGPAKGIAMQAAKLAGYANPESNAHRLMEHDGISRAIHAINDELYDDAIATAHEVQAFLTGVFRGTECRSLAFTGMGEPKINADGEHVDEPADPKDRVKAAEVLAKIRGYVAPVKSEVDVKGSPIVTVYLPDNGRDP